MVKPLSKVVGSFVADQIAAARSVNEAKKAKELTPATDVQNFGQ